MKNFYFVLLLLIGYTATAQLNNTVYVAPLGCYPQFSTSAEMDAAADASNSASPFATWKGAYDYALANGYMTIDFAPGHYIIDNLEDTDHWGDADGGFVLPDGMTVNGNGAYLDNNPVGSSVLCFATLGSNCTVSGFTFEKFSGNPNGGALYVPGSATNWTISDCDFFSSNQGTDALVVDLGAASTGTISGCDFYGNNNPLGTYPQSPGVSTSSAMNVLGTGTLNVENSTYSCNFRNVSGGAVKIETACTVNFTGCTFYRNEANASIGGAVVIRNNATVTFTSTTFQENFNTGGTTWDAGAVAVESGSSATFTGCIFKDNGGADTRYGGAIYANGASASAVTIVVTDCIFEGNMANESGGDGGGIYVSTYTNMTVSNSLFLANEANDKGSGIHINVNGNNDDAKPYTLLVENSTFTDNISGTGSYDATIYYGPLVSSETNFGPRFDITGSIITASNDNSIAMDQGGCFFCDPHPGFYVTNSHYETKQIANASDFYETGNTIGSTTLTAPNYSFTGTGWTGTFSSPAGLGTCPSPAAPADDCTDEGSIAGVAFGDTEGSPDGIDNNTAPIAGMTVTLYCGGTAVGTVTTAADGSYFFGGLENGQTYQVEFGAPPVPYIGSTLPNVGATGTDSDIDGSNLSPVITICTTCGQPGVDATDATSGFAHYGDVDAGFSTVLVPVELLFFKGETANCINTLSWATASETNNSHFEIQHSTDGLTFSSIGEVEGTGTTVERQNYSFSHEVTSSKNYYRLKQVDWEGSSAFSNIVIIQGICGSDTEITSVYPNPVTEQLFVEFIAHNSKTLSFEIVNLLGQVIYNETIQSANREMQKVTLPVGSIQNGVYFLRIKENNTQIDLTRIIISN